MPKRSEEYMYGQRRRFCTAAMACFSRNGVAATNLTDICNEAGLSMGALYKHFSSREDLLEAVLQLRLEHRNALVRGKTWDDLKSALIRYRKGLEELPFWREFQGVVDWNERLLRLRVEQAHVIMSQMEEQLARYVNAGEIAPALSLSRTAQLISVIIDGSFTAFRSRSEFHVALDDLAAYFDLAVGAIKGEKR
jgi:AcrR family transcriptional regulator